MQISIVNLSPDMAEQYAEYFDNRAFADGNPQKGCYCVWHHWTEAKELERSTLPENERPFCKRRFAVELIQEGKLKGFAAMCRGEIVGFCNADLKDNYFRLSRENKPETWVGLRPDEKVLAVVCFTVAPDMRRQGIAKAMLAEVCRYAAENGFDVVEGYPSSGEFKVSDCGGSRSMFEGCGFTVTEIQGGIIARKRFSEA